MSYTDPDAPKSKPIVDGDWIRGVINKYWAEKTTQGAILIIYRILVHARLTNGEWDYGVHGEDHQEHCYGTLTWKKRNGDIVPKIRAALRWRARPVPGKVLWTWRSEENWKRTGSVRRPTRLSCEIVAPPARCCCKTMSSRWQPRLLWLLRS